MANKNEIAAQIMEHFCEHSAHGYSQGGNRWGNGTIETLNVDGNSYSFYGGDGDCSSFVIRAYQAAGVPVRECGATFTGNMKQAFLATGYFEVKPLSFIAQRGDVYLNEVNHTAMCLSAVPDILGEACINEKGEIVGGIEGDQTGNETRIGPYYDFYPQWDCILHYVDDNAYTKPSGANVNNAPDTPGIMFRIRVDGEWSAESCSPLFSVNNPSSIEYIAIDMPGWYQVKTQRNGWLPKVFGYNVNDLDLGCAGDGSPITAIRCYYETEYPTRSGWLCAKYRVLTRKGWLPYMEDLTDTSGSGDDFAGDGNPILGFEIITSPIK